MEMNIIHLFKYEIVLLGQVFYFNWVVLDVASMEGLLVQ